MSLSQLRDLRHAGQRPAFVSVLIGRPASFDDHPGVVVINRDPSHTDLSPLVGLPVHVIDLQGDTRLTLRTLAALEELKVKPLGVCGPAGSCGVSPEHETAMQIYREALCTKG